MSGAVRRVGAEGLDRHGWGRRRKFEAQLRRPSALEQNRVSVGLESHHLYSRIWPSERLVSVHFPGPPALQPGPTSLIVSRQHLYPPYLSQVTLHRCTLFGQAPSAQ